MTPRRLIILHSNDIHGNIEGLARIATLAGRVRSENPGVPVLYLDLGDVEDSSVRVSSYTKGAAMHKLLSVAGCDAATIGNAGILSYGGGVIADHAAAASYPLVLANLRTKGGSPLPGAQPTALLDLGDLRLGLIGITSEMWSNYETRFGLRALPVLPLIEELMAALRQDGADAVILLSHMGLGTDRELAEALAGIPLILGAHSHDLLPQGERIGDAVIAQAGWNAEHLGRVDLLWDGESLNVATASVLPVNEQVSPSPVVLAEAQRTERGLGGALSEDIGELAQPLDYAEDRECGVLYLLADVLRDRMRADIGLATGPHMTGPLPAGRITRGELWDVCHFTANPAAAHLSGAQISALVARGLDPDLARERPRPLRGQARGLMHLSGAELRDGRIIVGGEPVDPARTYRVAASDWELSYYGGYAEAEWHLELEYDSPTILREALEEHIRTHSPVRVTTGRMQSQA